MKLDILVFAAHPDDAELACSGTIAHYTRKGKKVGIIDLTQGELGTRGSAELRKVEAADSAKILRLTLRENLAFADGFFMNDREHQMQVIKKIRQYQPEIIIANAPNDRHPDHGKAGELLTDATFLAGLMKIKTEIDEKEQDAWRPRLFLQYIQDRFIEPDILFDISDTIELKIAAIKAFKSQFHNDEYEVDNEPQTYISSPGFFDAIIGRSAEFGKLIGAAHAEAFISNKWLGVNDLFDLK